MDSPRWADYRTSTDYPALYTALAAGLRIPCFVRDGDADRLCDIRMCGDLILAGTRGLVVLSMTAGKHFALADECQKINLRWLVPADLVSKTADLVFKTAEEVFAHFGVTLVDDGSGTYQSIHQPPPASTAPTPVPTSGAPDPELVETKRRLDKRFAAGPQLRNTLRNIQDEVAGTPPGYIHEDELPDDISDADYSTWFDLSFVPGGFGCRVGPWPLPAATPTETQPENGGPHGNE